MTGILQAKPRFAYISAETGDFVGLGGGADKFWTWKQRKEKRWKRKLGRQRVALAHPM